MFVFFAGTGFAYSQSPPAYIPDSSQQIYNIDTLLSQHYSAMLRDSNWLLRADKTYQSDVQQTANAVQNSPVIILLILLLVTITYLKIAYGKDLEELFQSIINQNISQQIFRAQSGDFNLSSVILHANFIVVAALFTQFVLVEQLHQSGFKKFSAILFLIFLFTLFYLGKIFLLKLLGVIFEMKSETDEYIFHFTTICKTLGLTLFPALFVFAFTQIIFSKWIMIVSTIMMVAFFLLLLFRGLSTARKFLYTNIYHFIIYVCVVEISMMFLFFKLLTKTIN